LHATILIAILFTLFANLNIHQAKAQDIGQSSILYEMVASNDTKNSEQDTRPNMLVRDSHYAQPSSLIATNGGIDFDYGNDESSVTEQTMPGTLLANTLIPSEQPEQAAPTYQRTETETYIVKNGDTLGEIAQRFGVNIGTILWANNRTATQYLRPGDSLRIPPVSGVLVTVKKGDTLQKLAKTYEVDVNEIAKANRLNADGQLSAGIEIILPGAEPLPQAAPSPVIGRRTTFNPNDTLVANQNQARFIQKPSDANPDSSPISKLLWPTSGHVITQYYGWRHTGLDIDGDFSSPLYAAHDGVVVTSGWNSGGYGLQAEIKSDDGSVETRYAHSSKLFVKVGDRVKRGQVIAMMGTTGRSTGTHLHFEVYINGRRVNPLAYLR